MISVFPAPVTAKPTLDLPIQQTIFPRFIGCPTLGWGQGKRQRGGCIFPCGKKRATLRKYVIRTFKENTDESKIIENLLKSWKK
jgi:hypothetical protein